MIKYFFFICFIYLSIQNPDWSFIGQMEEGGQPKLNGYVPTSKGVVIDSSGVTIATGVDLGRSAQDIKNLGLSDTLTNKLLPYATLRGSKALTYLKAHPLQLTRDEVDQLNSAEQQSNVRRIRAYYDKNTGQQGSFDKLTTAQQTVLTSISYQWGVYLKNVKNQNIKNMYENMLNGKWDKVQEALLNDTSKYQNRRREEGKVLKNNRWTKPNSSNTSIKSSKCSAAGGICSTTCSNGNFVSGLCPGASRCCVPKKSTGSSNSLNGASSIFNKPCPPGGASSGVSILSKGGNRICYPCFKNIVVGSIQANKNKNIREIKRKIQRTLNQAKKLGLEKQALNDLKRMQREGIISSKLFNQLTKKNKRGRRITQRRSMRRSRGTRRVNRKRRGVRRTRRQRKSRVTRKQRGSKRSRRTRRTSKRLRRKTSKRSRRTRRSSKRSRRTRRTSKRPRRTSKRSRRTKRSRGIKRGSRRIKGRKNSRGTRRSKGKRISRRLSKRKVSRKSKRFTKRSRQQIKRKPTQRRRTQRSTRTQKRNPTRRTQKRPIKRSTQNRRRNISSKSHLLSNEILASKPIDAFEKIISRFGDNFATGLGESIRNHQVAIAISNAYYGLPFQIPKLSQSQTLDIEQKFRSILGDEIASSLNPLSYDDALSQIRLTKIEEISEKMALTQIEKLVQGKLNKLPREKSLFKRIKREYKSILPRVERKLRMREKCCERNGSCCYRNFNRTKQNIKKLSRRTRKLLRSIEHRNENKRNHARTRRVLRRIFKRFRRILSTL